MTDCKVLDGGFAGQLSRHISEKIEGHPLWTAQFLATKPEAIYATHLDFLRAGADIIETNTYQASVAGLTKYLKITETDALNLLKEAVTLAKKAVETYMKEVEEQENIINKKPMVAGSCGPYGAYLHDYSEYSGSYGKMVSRQELIDWHKPRIQALLDAGVDCLALETIPCKEEAEALLELLQEFPHARAWLSFSCQGSGSVIADGSDFQSVAADCYRALPSQILAVGVNCIDPKHVFPLLKGINEKLSDDSIPLIVYPNRGGNYSAKEGWIPVPDNDVFGLPISEWLDLGVRYIGGCCRVFSDEIKVIRSEVNQYNTKAPTV